jgi:hypothetical protein
MVDCICFLVEIHHYHLKILHILYQHTYIHLQLLLLETLPSPLGRDHLCRTLANSKNSKHGVDRRHLRENTRIRNPHALESSNLQLGVNNRELILGNITHLGGAGGMVHGMCDTSAVLAQLLISLDLGAGCDFTLDPILEGSLLGDFARSFQAGDDGGGVVTLGVGEVAEVERGLDGGVRGGEVDAAAGAGAGDVGCHAEGVDGGFVAKTVEC